jgi:hypothetical protein
MLATIFPAFPANRFPFLLSIMKRYLPFIIVAVVVRARRRMPLKGFVREVNRTRDIHSPLSARININDAAESLRESAEAHAVALQKETRYMRSFKSILSIVTTFYLLLATRHAALSQVVAPGVSVSGDIRTGNCNVAGATPNNGLCQAVGCNGGAGPNPDNIQASIALCEYNGVLYGVGSGTGFRFGKTYVSLIYQNGNTNTCSRFPDGVAPTLQNLPQGDSDFASMHLGIWVVKPDGSGILVVRKQATVPGLQNYGSVSVREMQAPNLACFDPMRDPAPQLNALRACGALTIGPACNSSLGGGGGCNLIESLCNICRTNPEICNLFDTP